MAIVTGAAGGLGRGIALQLAGRGCIVAALDMSAEGAEETAARCLQAGQRGLNFSGGLDRD